MADAGAVRIRYLLETPSAGLARSVESLGAGIGAAEGLEAEVPLSTATAIQRLRDIYAEMARQVGEIDSGNAIKGEALAALAKMDIGLERLATGLSQPPGEESARALSMAVRRIDAAGAGIDNAIARIR